MAVYNPPLKNTQFIIYVGLNSQANPDTFQTNPTIATGDFKVSVDGGALANITTLPVVTPASSKLVKITLSASEMNGDTIMLVGSDAAGGEWGDIIITIHTTTIQLESLATAAALDAVDNFVDTEITDIRNRLPAALVGGRMDSSVGAMATDVITSGSLASSATGEIADAVWDEPLTEPAGVFGWGGTFRNLFNWFGALIRNKMIQTATTTTLRNDADNADISTSAISDDGTTFTRGEFS